MVYAKQHAVFLTVTCLEWKALLKEDRFKEIITDSLSFLVKDQRIIVYGFVIMSNHFHLIWQMLGNHKRDDVQRDFLKYTGQQILKLLKKEHSQMLPKLRVDAQDRKHQVWEPTHWSFPCGHQGHSNKNLSTCTTIPSRQGSANILNCTNIQAQGFMRRTKKIGYF